MTRSRRFFASSPWIATGTPDYVNLGYTSRGLAKQALMRLSRKSLAIFRKLGLVDPHVPQKTPTKKMRNDRRRLGDKAASATLATDCGRGMRQTAVIVFRNTEGPQREWLTPCKISFNQRARRVSCP